MRNSCSAAASERPWRDEEVGSKVEECREKEEREEEREKGRKEEVSVSVSESESESESSSSVSSRSDAVSPGLVISISN